MRWMVAQFTIDIGIRACDRGPGALAVEEFLQRAPGDMRKRGIEAASKLQIDADLAKRGQAGQSRQPVRGSMVVRQNRDA